MYITPILMISGYLIALLVARNTPLRRLTRAVVFIPVVIGLGVSSLLWYWLFSYNFGLVNRVLVDLGIIRAPIIWFGEDADRAPAFLDRTPVGGRVDTASQPRHDREPGPRQRSR